MAHFIDVNKRFRATLILLSVTDISFNFPSSSKNSALLLTSRGLSNISLVTRLFLVLNDMPFYVYRQVSMITQTASFETKLLHTNF